MAHAHYFEFILLGDSVGALYSALLLTRAGARVAVIGQIDGQPGEGPSLVPAVRVRPIQGAPSLFHFLLESGMAHEGTANLFAPRTPGLQLLGSELRLDLQPGEELGRELARERPTLAPQSAALQEALDRFGFELDGLLVDHPLPARGFFEGRAARKAFAKVERALPEIAQRELAPLLGAISQGIRSAPLGAPLDAVGLRAVARWRDADSCLVGGRRGLVDHLARLCSKYGAKVELETRVTSLAARGWKIEEVTLSNGQTYGCGSLLFGREVSQLAALAPADPKVKKALEDYAALAIPAHGVIGIKRRVSPRALPAPLRDRSVLLPARPIVEGAGAIVLAVDAPKEKPITVTALCPVPLESCATAEQQRALAERLPEALEDVLPFFREHARPPEEGPSHWCTRAYRFVDAGNLHAEGLDPKTPLSNVWMVSPQVLPGLGLEGELLAGRKVASWLHKGAVQPRVGAIARAIKRA